MHVEIQVALNFLISFLYNKLPRRRVNQFGEELENALKLKFDGHWYPEKPFKGSAFRCLKTTPPLDPVFEIAARESGMDLIDIQENLPQELSIWIDPGEVSYRMSEKGPVKILYSESDRSIDTDNPDREVIRTFNPEAQCFKPIESTTVQFGGLSLSANGCSPIPGLNGLVSSAVSSYGGPNPGAGGVTTSMNSMNGGGNIAPTPVYKPCPSAVNGYHLPKSSSNNVTFTTATFAQTKFGSTKLKSNSKRSHRMSPTEFSNYIKQREMIQQQQAAAAAAAVNGNSINGMASPVHGNNGLYGPNTSANNGGGGGGGSLMGSVSPHNSRSISPIGSSYDSLLFGDRLSSMVGKPSVLPLFNGGGGNTGGQSSLSMANGGGNSLSIRSPSSRFSPNTITDDLLQQSLLQNALHSSSSPNGLDAVVNGCQFSDLLGSDLIKSSNNQGGSLSPSQMSNNVLRFSSLFDTSTNTTNNNNSNTKQSSQSTLNGNLSNSCSSSRNPFNGLSGSSLSDSNGSASSSVSSSPPSSSSLLSNGGSGRLTSGYESTATSMDNSTSGLSSMMGVISSSNNPIGNPLLITSSSVANSSNANTFESTVASISSSSPHDTTSNGTNSTPTNTSNVGANGSSPSSASEISDSSSPLLAANSSKGFDSISFNSNGVYPNQYQHLLVAN